LREAAQIAENTGDTRNIRRINDLAAMRPSGYARNQRKINDLPMKS
jgi:hypothetical protein